MWFNEDQIRNFEIFIMATTGISLAAIIYGAYKLISFIIASLG